jgi:hypothetical protein
MMFLGTLKEAYLLARASNLAQRGHVTDALNVLDRLPRPSRNKAVVEALRAYLQIVNNKTDDARTSIERSKSHAGRQTTDGEFVQKYCDYLDAMVDDRKADFNRLALDLASSASRSRSLLVVDPPMPG